jgi:hypothetical protein
MQCPVGLSGVGVKPKVKVGMQRKAALKLNRVVSLTPTP